MEGLTPAAATAALLAYIGPGAGFAFAGYLMIVLSAILILIAAILLWPLRVALRPLLHRNRPRIAGRRRIVVLGLDGLDPGIVDQLMADGDLPHFQRLAAAGSYHRLASTCPPISPVAWSTFMTGANPGKHNIFDFVTRDPRTYQLRLATADIRTNRRGKATIRGFRKSKTFWQVLGEYGIYSTILRVPVTFPPERLRGRLLAGMSVPDLLGTQGTGFVLIEGDTSPIDSDALIAVTLTATTRGWSGRLPGPPRGASPNDRLSVPITVRRKRGGALELVVQRRSYPLAEDAYTPWIRVAYPVGRARRAHGIARARLAGRDPLRLYFTPVHVDPERPVFPIGWPAFYSIGLAKRQGAFATAGIAEDTAAYNEEVIDGQGFLDQVYDIHREREAMFFHDLARTRTGVSCCVFDTPDRVQHMFYREFDAARGDAEQRRGSVLGDLYRRMDALVGETVKRLRKRDILLVLSDHGFTSFRQGVNLNTWLHREGYLVLKEGSEAPRDLSQADWSKTRAYALGLSGIFLNLQGREQHGGVPPGEAGALLDEIAARLAADGPAIRKAHRADEVYQGPYRENAPDLVIGYETGYRVSWSGALGKLEDEVITDNPKHWSGDHCVDPDVVPGILFTNRSLDDDAAPRLMDIAPTILDLFDVPVPRYMDGAPLPLSTKS